MIVCVVFFTKDFDENKNESFLLNMNIKINLNFFGHNKKNFQPRT